MGPSPNIAILGVRALIYELEGWGQRHSVYYRVRLIGKEVARATSRFQDVLPWRDAHNPILIPQFHKSE